MVVVVRIIRAIMTVKISARLRLHIGYTANIMPVAEGICRGSLHRAAIIIPMNMLTQSHPCELQRTTCHRH